LRGIGRAALLFLLGSAGALAALLAVKLTLTRALGEGIHRLPDIELERIARLFRQSPVTRSPLLILGDSTATFSLDAADFPDATSFATVNTTTVEAYFLLRRALASGARPRCVLAAFSFNWELSRQYFWPMLVGGGFYSPAELAELVDVSRGYGEEPGSRSALYRAVRGFAAEEGIWDDVTVPRLQEGIASLAFERDRVRAFRQSVWSHRGSAPLDNASRFEGKLDLAYDRAPAMTRTEEEFFRRFLVLLESHGIRFFLFEVPFAESVPAGEAEAYWRSYESLLREVPAAPVLLRPPPMPPELYLSAGHLNSAGIRRAAPFVRGAVKECFR
jgi:hypothetical protein